MCSTTARTSPAGSPCWNSCQSPSYYAQLQVSYDELFYRQEALGEYLNVFTGRVYHAYSEANKVPDVRFAPEAGLCWTLDFNVTPDDGDHRPVDQRPYLRAGRDLFA